jgi:hypothetical protein
MWRRPTAEPAVGPARPPPPYVEHPNAAPPQMRWACQVIQPTYRKKILKERKGIMNRNMKTVLTTVATAGLLFGAAAQASASPGEARMTAQTGTVAPQGRIDGSCGPRYNAFEATNVQGVDTAEGNGFKARLIAGNLHGRSAWAKVEGSHGMRVWMDWSDRAGDWHQCGPFAIDGGNQGEHERYTYAINQIPGRLFRACGDRGAGQGGHVCTTPWHHV